MILEPSTTFKRCVVQVSTPARERSLKWMCSAMSRRIVSSSAKVQRARAWQKALLSPLMGRQSVRLDGWRGSGERPGDQWCQD